MCFTSTASVRLPAPWPRTGLCLGGSRCCRWKPAGGGGVPVPDDGGGPPTALANLVLQVFDETQARVVAETRGSAEITIGVSRSQLAVQVLHIALARAQPDVLRMLMAQAP